MYVWLSWMLCKGGRAGPDPPTHGMLQDIHTAALQAGVEIDIPENCVQKVGEFKQLAMRAEQDGHLRQKLQHVLKLSKEKWDEARDHAVKAVVADNRMRAWCVHGHSWLAGDDGCPGWRRPLTD